MVCFHATAGSRPAQCCSANAGGIDLAIDPTQAWFFLWSVSFDGLKLSPFKRKSRVRVPDGPPLFLGFLKELHAQPWNNPSTKGLVR